MATVRECEDGLRQLAARLAGADRDTRAKAAFERTLSCAVSDLGVVFGARLHDGELLDIRQVSDARAQVRMTVGSDDLLRLVSGELGLGIAWATGRVKIHAGVRDLLELRTIF